METCRRAATLLDSAALKVPETAAMIVDLGAVPKLVEMLAQGRNRRAILLLLYHLSSEERIRKLFTYTEAIPIVMQMVINFPVRRQLSVVTVLCVCVCFVVEVNYFYITLLTILLIIL